MLYLLPISACVVPDLEHHAEILRDAGFGADSQLVIRPDARYTRGMRIIVTGDRFWTCHDLATGMLKRLIARYGRDIVIAHHGGPGVDHAIAQAARGLPIDTDFHSADLRQVGDYRFANRELVRPGAGLCVIVHRPPLDKASKDLARQAIMAGILTYLIVDERGVPRRIKAGDEKLEQLAD